MQENITRVSHTIHRSTMCLEDTGVSNFKQFYVFHCRTFSYLNTLIGIMNRQDRNITRSTPNFLWLQNSLSSRMSEVCSTRHQMEKYCASREIKIHTEQKTSVFVSKVFPWRTFVACVLLCLPYFLSEDIGEARKGVLNERLLFRKIRLDVTSVSLNDHTPQGCCKDKSEIKSLNYLARGCP